MNNRFLAVILAAGMAIVLNACNTATAPLSDPQVAQNENVQQDQESFIAQVDPFVKLTEGKFVLEAQAARALSPESLARANQHLEAINAQVSMGALIANADMSLSLPGAGISALANANGWKLYWWGFRLALDATRTRKVIAALATGASASALISLIPFPPTAIGGKIVAALLGIGTGALSYCNAAGHGVYIYRSWVGVSWCRSQPS